MSPITIAGGLLLFIASGVAWAQSAQVEGVRVWPAPDNTRVVLDLNGAVEHTLFTLSNPDRVVIDIRDARFAARIKGLDFSQTLMKGIRAAVRNGDDVRVVLDMKKRVRPKSFVLKPNQEYGHRLVIDLHDTEAKADSPPVRKSAPANLREVVVAIDPGHGGEDPGASGPRGTREKDVVLAVGRKLAQLVQKEPGMRAVMIRDGDYFVGLAERVQKAREHRADLLISIHADAFHDPRARGASVYALSQSGASSEHAKLLAERENNSDLVGGVSLDDKDDLLASVLLDLSQTATLQASIGVANQVLHGLRRVSRVHKPSVEQAGFRVLKSPDVPSILIETAFISNPDEERALLNSRHQQEMAKAIMEGIRGYFRHNAPPGTILAEREERRHTIGRGETLSGIARLYRVNLDTLRSANNLSDDQLQVGSVLNIPES